MKREIVKKKKTEKVKFQNRVEKFASPATLNKGGAEQAIRG